MRPLYAHISVFANIRVALNALQAKKLVET